VNDCFEKVLLSDFQKLLEFSETSRTSRREYDSRNQALFSPHCRRKDK
jgi:hypothetical protein